MTKKRGNPETEARQFSVVEAWLGAGIPLAKLQNAKLKSVLEDGHPRLATSSTLSEQIPLIHAVELDKARSELRKNIKPRGDNGEIDTMEIALFLDGATRVAEGYCFVARFVFEGYIQQRIIALRMLSKSLTAAKVADQFNKVVTA